MPIILENLDLQLNTKLYNELLKALDSGAVRKVSQKSAKSWLFMLKHGDELVECEVNFNVKTVQNAKCACGKSSTKKPCFHVWLASLWFLKNKSQGQQSDLEHQDPISNDILYNIDESSLKSFLSFSLKSNPTLSRYFQVRFCYMNIGLDVSQKYIPVLNKFDHPPQLTNHQLIKNSKHQFIALELMYEAIIDLVKKYDMIDVFYASLSTLRKLCVWSTSIKNPEKFIKFSFKIHQLIYESLRSLIEPEIREVIFQEMISTIRSDQYELFHHNENLLKYVFDFYPQPKFRKILLEVLVKNLLHFQNANDHSNFSFHVLFTYFETTDIYKLMESTQFAQNVNQTVLQHYIQFCLDKRNYAHLMDFFSYLFKHGGIKKTWIVDKYMEASVYMQNDSDLVHIAKTAFLETLDIKYGKIYIQQSENLSEQQVIDLISQLKKNHAPAKVILQFAKETENLNILENEILLNQDLLLTMQFDQELLVKRSPILYKFYLDKTVEYMKEYAGKNAFQFIENIKLHFRKNHNKSFEKNFNEDLKLHFPERIALFQSNP